ncbi:hypothetical protein CUR178_02373 [Leishmania enriettii]|uniref:Uncharacterized protein n=1 Tax=Leishmania enriettii TaxID=5663 RepID=A0A836KEL0_LEIEN|nr:hypothetical protein CUR178_02373 [Leishmania enriettii]
MQYRYYTAVDGTPNAPPEGVADGCYAFSPSCETASSSVSVMDRVNEFDCHVPTKDNSTPLRPTLQRVDRPSDIHATTGAYYARAAPPPPPARGAQLRLINASTDRGSRTAQSSRTYGPMDNDLACPATIQVDPYDVTLSSSRLGGDSTCWLQGSPISFIQAEDTAAHYPAVVAEEHGGSHLSDGARVFRPTVSIGGAPVINATSVTPLSQQARIENTRRPRASSSPMTTFAQARGSDVAELRSHLSALLRQGAALPVFGTDARHNGTVSETNSMRGRSSGPPSSSPLRRSGSDSGMQFAAVWPNQPPGRASHLQSRTSNGLQRPSAGAPSAPTGRRMSSFSALSHAPEAAPVLGRASEPFLCSMAAHQQLPSPSLMCPSESATHVAGTGRSSRASQDVHQARAQLVFDAQATELTRELDEQLELVFTRMRRVMILDARAAAGQASITEDYRDALVGQLEQSEDATAHTTLRFVELSNRHALEWINQGQYSAALELLQRADGLLRKDAGRLFRYLPDPVELDAPSFRGVAGRHFDPRYSHGTAPMSQPAAASAPTRSSDLEGPAAIKASDSGRGANHISSGNTVRCMSVPFFSPSQEPQRLKAVAAVEHNFGVYHFKLGEYTLATARFARSAALEEELQAPGIGITYFNMAQAQHGLRQLTEALRYAVLAEEAVERQVFFMKDKATRMQRRLAEGDTSLAVNLPEGADAVRRSGVYGGEGDGATANAPAGDHCCSDAAATTRGGEEKAVVRTWLQWRESVCFLSYVKQTHADWLDEIGLYKAAYHCYQEAHRWLLAVPRLASEEQQRAQLLKQYMATMKKRWRREEVEVELYQHPLRRSSTSTSGTVPTVLRPSRASLSFAPSKHRAGTLQRSQLSPAALSAAMPIARDFRSPLQSTIVTSVLPRAVEVIGRHPSCRSLAHGRAGLPNPQEGQFLRPPASTSAARPLATAQARRRPSSASTALYSAYGSRQLSASLFPHGHGTGGHVTATAEQDCPHLAHAPQAQREPRPHRQQRRGGRPSWNPSTHVPIPLPSRRTSHRTPTERDESAAPGPLPRRSSVYMSHDSAGRSDMLTSAHLPLRPSPSFCSAHTPLASQHHHSPPQESAPTSSTSAESCVVRSLIFEVELGSKKRSPRHRGSESVLLDTLSAKGMDTVASRPPPQRCESPAAPRGGSAGAGVSDLKTSASSAARTPSVPRASSPAPVDLTWCVTVLQAFLRPRCRRQTLLGTEAERGTSVHTARDRERIQWDQRPSPSEASAVMFGAPGHTTDTDREDALGGNGTSSGEQSRSLPPKSAAVPMVRLAEPYISQRSSVGLSGALVSDAAGTVPCRRSVAQPSLSPSSSVSAAVAHSRHVEGGASHSEAATTGEGDMTASTHRSGKGLCADVAAIKLEPPAIPSKGETDAGIHEGTSSNMSGECGSVAVALLMERGESSIPHENDGEGARDGSAAEEPSGAQTPLSFHRDRCRDVRGSVGADALTVTSRDVITFRYSGTAATASAPSPVNRENDEVLKADLCELRLVDNAVVLQAEPLDSRRRSRIPMVEDALDKREEGRRLVDAFASTFKASVPKSSEMEDGDAWRSPSESQASSAAGRSRGMPSLPLREPGERVERVGAVPAPAALPHSSHADVSLGPHTTCPRAGQADRPNRPGRDVAGKAETGSIFEAAYPTLSGSSRGDDVDVEAEVRGASLCGLPPPHSASSAVAENRCPCSAEYTAPHGGLLMRRSISANPVRSIGEMREAAQRVDSSASVYTVDLEVEDGRGSASERVREAKEEKGAADVLTTARGSASVRSPEQLTTPVSTGHYPHQRSRAATLFPASPPSRSRGSCRSAPSTGTRSASVSHVEGAETQRPQGSANAKAIAVGQSAEASEVVEGARPSEAAEITPRPPATQPPRRGRVFVFVPHKIAALAPIEPTNANSSAQSDDARECIRFSTLTSQQSAAALDTEAVEDGAAKSLLRLAGGSRTSGSPDAPLSFNEEYCGAAAMDPYTTTDDETLGRHTASIGSNTNQVTQLRESFWRSTHDGNEPRAGEGGLAVTAAAQQLLVKLGSVELAKATSLGTAVTPEQIAKLPDSAELVGAIEAPVKVSHDLKQAADEDEKPARGSPQDLLPTHERDVIEGVFAPPQCVTCATKTPTSLNSVMPPCSSLILAPAEASAAVVPVEGSCGSSRAADLEMRPMTVSSPASLTPESPEALPEMPEAFAGMLSPQNPPLGADEAIPYGEGGGHATTEGEEVGEDDTSAPAKEVRDVEECAYRNARLSSEGTRGVALTSNELSLNHASRPRPPGALETQSQQQHHRHRAPSSGALRSPALVQKPGTNGGTWSDMETEEAQRRYISDQIVQEEAAIVIQQAWREHAAARLRRQMYLLL